MKPGLKIESQSHAAEGIQPFRVAMRLQNSFEGFLSCELAHLTQH